MKKIAKDMRVAVIDGGRGLILVNTGTALEPRLSVVRSYEIENPPSREQGRDKPGRFNDPGGEHRSAVEIADLHQKAEDAFVSGIIADLDREAADDAFDRIVIAAPPIALGVVRKTMGAELKKRVVKEIAADYVKMPLPDIARAVQRALEG